MEGYADAAQIPRLQSPRTAAPYNEEHTVTCPVRAAEEFTRVGIHVGWNITRGDLFPTTAALPPREVAGLASKRGHSCCWQEKRCQSSSATPMTRAENTREFFNALQKIRRMQFLGRKPQAIRSRRTTHRAFWKNQPAQSLGVQTIHAPNGGIHTYIVVRL